MTAAARRILVAATALISVGGFALVRMATPRVPATSWPIPAISHSDTNAREDLGEEVLRIVGGDPFRLERRPASVPFGAAAQISGQADGPTRVAPVISGLIGPPWRAVLEGVPGRQGGVLVAEGDTVGGYRIVRVRATSVDVQAPDTLWRLTVRRVW